MNLRFKKSIIKTVCVILTLILFVSASLNIFAVEASSEKRYVKDVKLIYAESVSEAKKYLPEGYTLLEYDLNKGTEYVYDVYEVYMAYSTTTDPDEAVTDIKMMNMKGGYVYSNYEEQIRDIDHTVREMTDQVVSAINLFVENYKKGTYGAKAAYRALSVLTVDEAGGQSLADYILYGNPSYEFYVKLVLNAHRDIISLVLSALAMAVQGEEGDTWLDRLAEIDDPDLVNEKEGYWNKATILWEHFYSFYDVYQTIDHELYRNRASSIIIPGENEGAPPEDVSYTPPESKVENTGVEILYEVAHIALEQYSFGNGILFSNFFVNENIAEEDLYCLVEVLTPEEYAMMRLCGPLCMILSTAMNEEVYNDYVSRVDEITKNGESCSIWAGINSELLLSSIGITDRACRALAESEFERELNNQGDSTMETVLLTAGLVAAAGTVSLGIGVLGMSLFAGSLGAMLTGSVASTTAVVLSIAGSFFAAAGIAALAIALVVVIVYFFVWLSDWWDEHHPEYTKIPEYIYDYVADQSGNSQFLLYEGVKFQDGSVADVNAKEGKEWHAMYFSKDKAAGAPIEADIIVRYGDGRIDEGYSGLAAFGHINAQNLNQYADDDEVNGIFVTYRQEDLEGDYARGTYLSDVKLFSDKNEEKCKIDLANEKYVLYNLNLTPDSEYYTYLGYQTTNSADLALTDIRLFLGYSTSQHAAGGGSATYAASGSTGDKALTIYTTRISLFGSPILSNFLVLNDRNAPAGYEPVNLFSGGDAVNFNMKDGMYVAADNPFYLYFLPEEAYTGGTEYLGGLATIFDLAFPKYPNGKNSVANAAEALGYKTLYTAYGNQETEGALVYTTTYNPYRAIYGVTAASVGGDMGKYFEQTIRYDDVGYSLADRYLVLASDNNRIRYEYDRRNNDSRLYVASIYSGGTPMKLSDLYVSEECDQVPEGFVPVSARLSDNGRAVDLGNAFNYKQAIPGVINSYNFTMSPMYLFLRGEGYKEGNYVTNIYVSSKEQKLGGIDVGCKNLDNSYVMNDLAFQGAHTVINKNLNLEDSNNATYFGYTKKVIDKTKEVVYPITNVVLYYAGETSAAPEITLTVKDITYELASSINLLCEENGEYDVCKRVYLYFTTNPAAGSPIIDIKIDNTAILNGWETVRTQNGKALYDDMDAFSSSMWFMHLKRNIVEPKYISDVVIGVGDNDAEAKAVLIAAGCEYMLEKDLNNNVGLLSDYIYLGYKRTSDPNAAIRDLRTTHDEEVDSFVKNGATYYKIEGNLNSYTNIFADDIFLYYTKDAKAGLPIVALETSKNPVNSTRDGKYLVSTVVKQDGKASDLNDGALGEYIYLLQIRDKTDRNLFASMIGNGSIVIIIALALISVGVTIGVVVAHNKRRKKATSEKEAEAETPTQEELIKKHKNRRFNNNG